MHGRAPARGSVTRGVLHVAETGRLGSWKEIAACLGRDVRTVQRWERARNLPVHRVPGGERPTVFAFPSELDDWLAKADVGIEPSAEEHGSPSIAVLPFENMSRSSAQRFLGDSLADEIINALARTPGIVVAARTSSFALRGQNAGIREIGRLLGVGRVLEGAVESSGAGSTVRYQLIDVRRGFSACSGRFDCRRAEYAMAFKYEIAQAIAEHVRECMAGGPPG